MTAFLDLLPIELIAQIAAADRAVYWPLATGYPRFGRSLTPGRRVDFAIDFGHGVSVERLQYGPALVWRLNGPVHRVDGPAIDYGDTRKCWMIRSRYHREGAPAVECAFTVISFSMRVGGGITLCEFDRKTPQEHKTLIWYKYGDYHRPDGPAVISGGLNVWAEDGKYIKASYMPEI